MKLILLNGYPYPYPQNLTEYDQEDLANAASGNTLEISGIVHFEWLHTVTVEFESYEVMHSAQTLTGWERWSPDMPILEAFTSIADGYDHPAILANGMAYCGFILKEDNQ